MAGNYTASFGQRVIKVNYQAPRDKEHIYAMINIAAMTKAQKELNGSALNLWLLLARNQNGYEFALSPKAVFEEIGMSKSSYERAFKELQEKEYLVENKGVNGRDYFDFFELGRKKSEPKQNQNGTVMMPEVEQNQLKQNQNGTVIPLEGCQNGSKIGGKLPEGCQNGSEKNQNGSKQNQNGITNNTYKTEYNNNNNEKIQQVEEEKPKAERKGKGTTDDPYQVPFSYLYEQAHLGGEGFVKHNNSSRNLYQIKDKFYTAVDR